MCVSKLETFRHCWGLLHYYKFPGGFAEGPQFEIYHLLYYKGSNPHSAIQVLSTWRMRPILERLKSQHSSSLFTVGSVCAKLTKTWYRIFVSRNNFWSQSTGTIRPRAIRGGSFSDRPTPTQLRRKYSTLVSQADWKTLNFGFAPCPCGKDQPCSLCNLGAAIGHECRQARQVASCCTNLQIFQQGPHTEWSLKCRGDGPTCSTVDVGASRHRGLHTSGTREGRQPQRIHCWKVPKSQCSRKACAYKRPPHRTY